MLTAPNKPLTCHYQVAPQEKVAWFCTFYRPRAARGTGRSALLSRQQSPFGMAGWAVYDRLGFIFALYLLVHRFDRFEDQLIDGTSWVAS